VKFLKNLAAHWLRHSHRVHLRTSAVNTYPELVALIDRFIDGSLRYPLEWDDFISWQSNVPNIEVIRARIAETEPLFFSANRTERAQAVSPLVQQRNIAASFSGLLHGSRLTIRSSGPLRRATVI